MLREFIENDIPFLVEISNQCFGKDYLTSDYFNLIQTSTTLNCWVKIRANYLVGFIVIERITNQNLSTNFHDENEWISEFLGIQHARKTILIKQVAVHPNFQNKGIATELIQAFLDTYKYESISYISILWNRKQYNGLKNILSKMNFTCIKQVENFWQKDSLEKKYLCAECESIPCVCSASIYYYQFSDSKKNDFN
ncbi:MAG: GNAT family N-acetyltransferase [Vicingaceae bacterium]|nr:GNAT family N-acetyltransferase [Vicingaceae bacterium]